MSITRRQYEVLTILSQDGPWSVQKVALTLGITSAAATKLLLRLESQGWVKRELDEWDHRRVKASLTPVGKKMLKLERSTLRN